MTLAIEKALKVLDRSSLNYRARLIGRIKEVSDAYSDDYGAEPSGEALASMVTFLEATTEREYHSLTVTPEGGWYLEWQLDANSRLAVEFATTGVARVICRRPNPRHHEKLDVFTVTTTADALTEALAPWNPWKVAA